MKHLLFSYVLSLQEFSFKMSIYLPLRLTPCLKLHVWRLSINNSMYFNPKVPGILVGDQDQSNSTGLSGWNLTGKLYINKIKNFLYYR